MHWIKTLREQLQITQEELGHYLQLSLNTIKSVEVGRRSLPPESLTAAAALFGVIRNASLTRVAIDAHTPSLHYHTGRARQLHRQCCRRLDRTVDQLNKMKKSHATACFALGVYQALAEALSAPINKQDHARLTWAQRQIKDTVQRIDDTSPVAQDLLAAEIVGLKSIANSLELIQLNAECNTPIAERPEYQR